MEIQYLKKDNSCQVHDTLIIIIDDKIKNFVRYKYLYNKLYVYNNFFINS